MSYYECSEAEGLYTTPVCVRVPSGVRDLALFSKAGYEAMSNFESLSDWNGQITNGECKLIPKTRGSKPVGSPKYAQGWGSDPETLISRDCAAEFFVAGDPVNRDFWDAVSKNGGYYVAFHFGEGSDDYVGVTPAIASVVVDFDIPIEIDGEVVFKGEIKWKHRDLINVYDTPAGLF